MSRASAHHVSPCVTTTQLRRISPAYSGRRFLPDFAVLPVGTQPWIRPVTASAVASRCATAWTRLILSISGRHPGSISGSVAMDSIAGAIGR